MFFSYRRVILLSPYGSQVFYRHPLGAKDAQMPCRGICLKLKAKKPLRENSGRYIAGQKRCQVCEIFILWPEYFCPCCGYRLRTRPRNFKYKSKMKEAITLKNEKFITVQK